MAATERGGGVADLGGETAVYLRQRWVVPYTSIVPAVLGKAPSAQENNLVGLLGRLLPPRGDGGGGQHSQRQCAEPVLLDAIEHPEQYPNLDDPRLPAKCGPL